MGIVFDVCGLSQKEEKITGKSADIRCTVSIYGIERGYDTQLVLTDSNAVCIAQYMERDPKTKYIQVELNKRTTALLRRLIDAMYAEHGSALVDNLPKINSYIRCSDSYYSSISFNCDDMIIRESFYDANVKAAYDEIGIEPFKKEYYTLMRLVSEIGHKLMEIRSGQEIYYDETRDKYFDSGKAVEGYYKDNGRLVFSKEFPRPTYYIREVIPIKDK